MQYQGYMLVSADQWAYLEEFVNNSNRAYAKMGIWDGKDLIHIDYDEELRTCTLQHAAYVCERKSELPQGILDAIAATSAMTPHDDPPYGGPYISDHAWAGREP